MNALFIVQIVIIGLCSFSANSLFSELLPGPLFVSKVFLSKNLSCFGFLAIVNTLSCNTLSEAVLLDKSIKSL